MKKLSLLLLPLAFIIVLPVLAHAASSFVPLAPIPGLTDVSTSNLAAFFNGLYKFCIGAAVVLAILEITAGGFMVMSGDSITAHSEGRDKIVGAILGLVLVLSPFLIFSLINPQILTLQIGNLDKLQPSSTTTATTDGSSGSPAADPTTETSCGTPTSSSENTIRSIKCPTDDLAIAWKNTNCPDYGTITKGQCTGGYTNGKCISGDWPTVTCPGVTTRAFTFVDVGSAKLRPVNSDLTTVQGFISGCMAAPSSGSVMCLLNSSFGGKTGATYLGNSTDGKTCPNSESYSRDGLTTSVANPYCYKSSLVCATKQDLCRGTLILTGN